MTKQHARGNWGVSQKRNRFRVKCLVKGVAFDKYFDTPDEAAKAYDMHQVRVRGASKSVEAYLNFPGKLAEYVRRLNGEVFDSEPGVGSEIQQSDEDMDEDCRDAFAVLGAAAEAAAAADAAEAAAAAAAAGAGVKRGRGRPRGKKTKKKEEEEREEEEGEEEGDGLDEIEAATHAVCLDVDDFAEYKRTTEAELERRAAELGKTQEELERVSGLLASASSSFEAERALRGDAERRAQLAEAQASLLREMLRRARRAVAQAAASQEEGEGEGGEEEKPEGSGGGRREGGKGGNPENSWAGMGLVEEWGNAEVETTAVLIAQCRALIAEHERAEGGGGGGEAQPQSGA